MKPVASTLCSARPGFKTAGSSSKNQSFARGPLASESKNFEFEVGLSTAKLSRMSFGIKGIASTVKDAEEYKENIQLLLNAQEIPRNFSLRLYDCPKLEIILQNRDKASDENDETLV